MTIEQEVQFENAGVKLSGTLTLPNAPGPHPAMVVVHGSGAANRHNWEEHTRHFATRGIAVLKYDKRGVGGSTGNWMTVRPQTLADDVLAGVNYLQKRPEINPGQVGVWGGSQGWTVGTLSAARSQGNTAFAIIMSGAPEGQWEQEKHRACSGHVSKQVPSESQGDVPDLQTLACKGPAQAEIIKSIGMGDECFEFIVYFEEQNKTHGICANQRSGFKK